MRRSTHYVYGYWLFFVVLLLFPAFADHELLCTPEKKSEFNVEESSDLYLELEKSLIEGNSAILEKLRAAFLTDVADGMLFYLQIQVLSGPNQTCGNPNKNTSGNPRSTSLAFCPTDDYMWRMCHGPIIFHFIAPSVAVGKKEKFSISIYAFVQWASLLHGNLLSVILLYATFDPNIFSLLSERGLSITLEINRLDCNPRHDVLICDVNDLFSWIKVYAEVGGMPETWDINQKGTTSLQLKINSFNVEEVTDWVTNEDTILNMCAAEYVFVSLSLALVIANQFPAYHRNIVTKMTNQKHRSLYWGAVMVSNFYIYGLIYLTGKAYSIFLTETMQAVPMLYVISCVKEVIVYIILFAAALLALRNGTDIPIPTGIAKLIINISFCFSCFCCCICCPSRCTSMILQVLVLFSFMCFIYYSIMDVISVGFSLLQQGGNAVTLTITTLHISFLFFSMLFGFYIILQLSTTTKIRNKTYRQQLQRLLNAVLGAFMLLIIFCAVMCSIIVYMLLVLHVQPEGITGLVTSLTPSIILSAAGWYIKKKLITDEGPEDSAEYHGSSTGTLKAGRIETII